MGSIQVIDTKPPTYTSVTESADPLELGGTETVTIYGVTDPSGIKNVLIEFAGSNHTMTNLGSGNWLYNSWTPNSTGIYSYTIYLQDNTGNWNATNRSIQVNIPPAIPAFTFPLLIMGIIMVSFFILKKRIEV